ncbi:MAG: hypothetical protein ACKO27_11565 [Ilumatobacteraceae bacterium]
MTDVLELRLEPQSLHCRLGDRTLTLPVGPITLARSIAGDPPAPADLTNAIGLVADHLDDVDRELPEALLAARVVVAGHGVAALADVELGAAAVLPADLTRAAAEEVFRTLATETAADRSRNPGLEAAWVHDILGTCCAVVAVMRHFALDRIELAS